jgi:hypothetical protein
MIAGGKAKPWSGEYNLDNKLPIGMRVNRGINAPRIFKNMHFAI